MILPLATGRTVNGRLEVTDCRPTPESERRERDARALEREIFRARLFGFKDLEQLYSDALAALAAEGVTIFPGTIAGVEREVRGNE